MNQNWTKENFHYPRISHSLLGQISQVDGNIQNNTSIKSQATVPQTTRHQTTKTFIDALIFQMPQYSVKKNAVWVFLKMLLPWASQEKKILEYGQ